MSTPLLAVEDLRVTLGRRTPVVPVDGLSLTIDENEVLGLVGESGCGKSMTSLALMRLVPSPCRIEGSVVLDGQELGALDAEQLRALRGSRLGMIFQEPMTSLDPVFTIGSQLVETIRAHRDVSAGEAHALALDLLARVGIDTPARRAKQHPHELSGGMRQRVMIAIALCNEPRLLIADEPTTALDVTVQAQIVEMIDDLRTERRMGVLLITHDLAVVGDVASRVAVMYAGELVEVADVDTIFDAPLHPYTQGLLRSLPGHERDRDLHVIKGRVPDLASLPAGCRFADRCPNVIDRCRAQHPDLVEQSDGRALRCFNPTPM